MKNQKRLTTLPLLLAVLFWTAGDLRAAAQNTPPARKAAAPPQGTKPKAAPKRAKAPASAATGAAAEDALKAELEELARQNLPAAERVARLEAFTAAHPDSASQTRALELLTSARAALGDEKLRTGDALAGIELFRRAVADAPLEAADQSAADRSDRLFAGVVSQLPANLYVLGHQDAAFDLAQRIEERVKNNPKHLLALAAFYFGVERADEAARMAEAATRLAPDDPRAHQALGEAHRFALRLEKAAEEYQRALELDPRAAGARRSLADLRRATGKPEEALALYREQLGRDAGDANARTGVVLSLFDAGRREEAERELQTALSEQTDSHLPLLVGVAYWYAAHNEGARALEFAEKAVALEPRFKWVWARITFGRALLAQKRPLEAERALRLARTIGRFPTLDYELACVLVAAGFYQEAAEELARTFALKDGEIETRLAGRTLARAASFTELLAPERRASIFQFNGADTDANARMLKALLAFHLAVRTGGATLEAVNEKDAVSAAAEFVAGDDELRAFRQLYVASRLLGRGAALQEVLARTDAAMGGVEAALDSPVASIATLADELYDLRARAIAEGATPNIPEVPRNLLSNILRGRIEDLAGWALYKQGQPQEALVRLKRATSVLPEGSPWWRASVWHLGAAHDASGNQKDALAAYVKSYRWSPDPTRRVVIEALYQKLNGSLDGLDKLLNAPLASLSSPPPATPANAPPPPSAGERLRASAKVPVTTSGAESTRTSTSTNDSNSPPAPAVAAQTPSEVPAEGSRQPATQVTPVQTATDNPPAAAPLPAAESSEARQPEAKPTPAASAPEQNAVPKTGGGAACALSVSESSVALKSNGGSAVITVSLSNAGGGDVSKINAATPNWADIIIFAEPRAAGDGDTARYTITSISQKAGTYKVTFTSPCGKQEVSVEVK